MPLSVETPAPVSTATRRPASASIARSTASAVTGSSTDTSVTSTSCRESRPQSFPACFAVCESGRVRIERVERADDDRLVDYRDLTDVVLRRLAEPAGGLYIAESAKVIARALRAGHAPRSVLVQDKWVDDVAGILSQYEGPVGDVPVYVVPAAIAEQVTGYPVHRGALAAMHRPQLPPVAAVLADAPRRSRIAVLEGLTDHANVGSAFRNAAALGVDAVLVTPTC